MALNMANIKASDQHIPLRLVVEHIAGNLGQKADNEPEEWDDLAFDEMAKGLGAGALADLIHFVQDGVLRVSGRREGNWDRQNVPSGLFANIVVINPFADIDFDIEDSGKANGGGKNQENGQIVLDFDENDFGVIFINKGLCVRDEVIWSSITADSGAEVLKLWPLQKDGQRSFMSNEAIKAWISAKEVELGRRPGVKSWEENKVFFQSQQVTKSRFGEIWTKLYPTPDKGRPSGKKTS